MDDNKSLSWLLRPGLLLTKKLSFENVSYYGNWIHPYIRIAPVSNRGYRQIVVVGLVIAERNIENNRLCVTQSLDACCMCISLMHLGMLSMINMPCKAGNIVHKALTLKNGWHKTVPLGHRLTVCKTIPFWALFGCHFLKDTIYEGNNSALNYLYGGNSTSRCILSTTQMRSCLSNCSNVLSLSTLRANLG